MAVAVKPPETSSSGLLGQLRVGILLGVLYVVGSFAILFGLLRWLWWGVLALSDTPVNNTGLILVGAAAAVVLGYGGLRLLGPTPTPGLRGGVFLALVSLLVVVLLTRWVSILFEGWVYDSRWMPEMFGIILTVAVGLALLAGAVRLFFFKPGYEQRLIALEEQGWFSIASYKRSQGQRVRRGTIVGILAIVGTGIWSLHTHEVLGRGSSPDWVINVPFTGKVAVQDLGDAAILYGNPETMPVVDQGTFREQNELLKRDYVKVEKRGDSDVLEENQLVTKKEFEEESKKLLAQDRQPPVYRSPEPAKGETHYVSLTLLPDVKYTLPLLLGALGLWGAWRLVNVPAFADFLIATEAELNKVSWTSRRRLFQDTVVVLVTVVLLTVFLFVVDFFWAAVLKWKPIGVLKLPEGTGQQQVQEQPY